MTHPSPIRTDRLLERFLRYVKVGTAADPSCNDYPSSPGQLELGKILTEELKAMGAQDAEQDVHGLVWATIPATVDADVPTVLFNSHVDTSPEAPGDNVAPHVIESYAGGDIPLAKDGRVIRVADCPELADLEGHCLVTTDGSTLLGGDDKAGVAAIMELANYLLENPTIPHGPVRILFTCDEEIGLGAKHMDLDKAGADAGYTLDGAGHGELEAENFSADQIVVRAIGYNIHPAIAKDRMKNALRALSAFIAALPTAELSPETTDGKQGFLHPYDLVGGVGEAHCKILLRDFDTAKLDVYETLIRSTAQDTEAKFPGTKFLIERSRQYRNMADFIAKSPQVVRFAQEAFEKLDRSCELGSIRGGTDGAQFSEMGLATPNLSVGQHNIHSVLEFASITEMTWTIEHAVTLLDIWQSQARS
ncbi:MAG: peptidase T [Planctomycetota bacterium]|nr:peptidase T [Planctomycetota bacterium]